MFWLDLVLVFFITLMLVGVLLAVGGGRYGEGWAGLLWLFALIFLVTWAVGLWIEPFGPPAWGSFWLPFLLVGVFITLLLAALAEPSRRRRVGRRGELPPQRPIEAEPAAEATEPMAAIGCGLFFWILLVVSISAIVTRYAWH